MIFQSSLFVNVRRKSLIHCGSFSLQFKLKKTRWLTLLVEPVPEKLELYMLPRIYCLLKTSYSWIHQSYRIQSLCIPTPIQSFKLLWFCIHQSIYIWLISYTFVFYPTNLMHLHVTHTLIPYITPLYLVLSYTHIYIHEPLHLYPNHIYIIPLYHYNPMHLYISISHHPCPCALYLCNCNFHCSSL